MKQDFNIKNIAELARLDLSAQEQKKYASQLVDVLGYVEQLQTLELGGSDFFAIGQENGWRQDEAREWSEEERVVSLEQSAFYQKGKIKVPKVL